MSRPALLLAALAWVGVLGPGMGAEAGAGPECRDCLRAGAATVVLRVPAGTPLGGYGAQARRRLLPDLLDRHPHAFWFESAEGERDPLRARALVLEIPPQRLAWVTVDLVAVDRGFTREVQERLDRAGWPRTTLILSASHTHSGPGAFVDSTLMGWLALDRFDAPVREALVDAVVEAVRRADAARGPALVGTARAAAPALTRSRLGRPLDPEVVVLKVTTPAGAPVALLWNYAIHGTVLGPRNLRLSGDVMGATSAELERELGVPVLFVNGAVGDVSPAGHGETAVADLGRALAEVVRGGWRRARPGVTTSLRTTGGSVPLPPARLSIRNCVGRWLPRALRLPVGGLFSPEARLTVGTLGDTAWVTIPGELQTALGLAIKREGGALFEHVFVAGVSNDYLGYFVTSEDYDRPHYVTCGSVYGPQAGACLAATAVELLYGLRGRRPPVTETRRSCDVSADAAR